MTTYRIYHIKLINLSKVKCSKNLNINVFLRLQDPAAAKILDDLIAQRSKKKSASWRSWQQRVYTGSSHIPCPIVENSWWGKCHPIAHIWQEDRNLPWVFMAMRVVLTRTRLIWLKMSVIKIFLYERTRPCGLIMLRQMCFQNYLHFYKQCWARNGFLCSQYSFQASCFFSQVR